MGSWLRDDARFWRVGLVGIGAGILVALIGSIPEDAFGKWLFATLFLAAGVVVFTSGFRQYRRRSLVRDTPTSDVRSLAMGTVELHGDVSPVDKPLQSPFSGEDCVFYEYKIEQYRDSAEGGGKFHHKEMQDERIPFELDDGTGDVRVEPEDATFRVETGNTYTVKQFDKLPDPAQNFINEQVLRDDIQEKMTGKQRWRFTETYLKAGDDAYVFGKAIPRDHDGSAVNEENAVITADDETPMFMIADRPEDELLTWMNKDIWGRLIGGGLFTLVAFAYLLHATGLL